MYFNKLGTMRRYNDKVSTQSIAYDWRTARNFRYYLRRGERSGNFCITLASPGILCVIPIDHKQPSVKAKIDYRF